MKVLRIILLSLLICSCKDRPINQRAGTYIGEAEVLRTITVASAGMRTERVIFDGTITDTLEVEVLDADERKYSIKRSGFSGSQYDIGSPRLKYIFDEEFFWGTGYTYDKKWVSRLDLSDKDLLVGYMLVEDQFGSQRPSDSSGNLITDYHFYEYRISASRQK